MPRIMIKTETGKHELYPEDEGWDELPNDCVGMTIEKIGKTHTPYEILTRMIKDLPRRLRSISIDNSDDSLTPDYLSFLVATFQKTESLTIRHTISHPAEMCCLMAALVPVNNLQELHIHGFVFEDDIHCLIQLLQGIASSSLVSLTLGFDDISSEPILVDELVKALKKNQTLKSLHLESIQWDGQNDVMLYKLLSVIAKSTEIKDLSLDCGGCYEYTEDDNFNILTENVWGDAFCCPQCKIEKLTLSDIRLDVPITGDGSSKERMRAKTKNTSIKFLDISLGRLCAMTMKAMLERFTSIQHLKLESTGLDTISHFQTYLLQDNSPLQSLAVEEFGSAWNKLSNDKEMESFLTNLPKMTSLRALNLRLPSFYEMKSCTRILTNVLPKCNLERLVYTHLTDKVAISLHLNRGGLKKLRNQVPSNLWPHILKRAGKIKYYDCCDRWNFPTTENRRVDVVYWLLREAWLPKIS